MVYGSISTDNNIAAAYVSSIVVYFAEIHNVFSTMKDEGRFHLKKELIILKAD